MKILLIILFIFFVITFFPLRLKFSILYNEENYYIKLYNFIIISKTKPIVDKTVDQTVKKKAKIKRKKDRKSTFINNITKSISPKILLHLVDSNRYKPKLKVNGTFVYSLGDASRTAISYGLISAVLPFLYRVLTAIFNIKNIDLPINPIFQDKFLLKIDITSIIYLSFAKVIYVIFLIIKSIIHSKEANLKKENI